MHNDKANVDGFAITFPTDTVPFRVREGRLIGFIAGIAYFDEAVFDSSNDAETLSKLVAEAIDAGVIVGDPRLLFYIKADQTSNEANWQIGFRRANWWTPQLGTGKTHYMNGITDSPNPIRAAICKAVEAANEALAELRGAAVIA